MTKLPLRARLLRFMGKQTWMPKGQDRLLRLIWPPDARIPLEFEVDFFGRRYPGNLDHFIDWTVFAYGAYSPAELDLLDRLAAALRQERGEIAFFDIGANAGHHTLFMADRADRVFAFEPLPRLQKLIAEKISRNALTNVRIMPFGLGREEGSFDYRPGIGANSGIGTFTETAEADFGEVIKLPIKTGDGVMSDLGLMRLDLVKIDVEGFERFVLEGLAATLKRDRPPILMELSKRSRAEFGSLSGFTALLYEGAQIAEVRGKPGGRLEIHPFDFDTSEEIVILPPSLAAIAVPAAD